jgi:hypothetical protein
MRTGQGRTSAGVRVQSDSQFIPQFLARRISGGCGRVLHELIQQSLDMLNHVGPAKSDKSIARARENGAAFVGLPGVAKQLAQIETDGTNTVEPSHLHQNLV